MPLPAYYPTVLGANLCLLFCIRYYISFILYLYNYSDTIKMEGAGIGQLYSAGLRAGWSCFPVPAGAGNFFLHHPVQTGSGAYPASYSMGTTGSFPGSNVPAAWSWPLTSI